MKWILRMTAVVLVGMATALPGVQTFALASTPPSAHGCHSHSSTPASPVRYQCCANGHNWAMATSPVPMPALVAVASWVESGLLSCSIPQVHVVAFCSSSPPGDLPLRI